MAEDQQPPRGPGGSGLMASGVVAATSAAVSVKLHVTVGGGEAVCGEVGY